MKRVFLFPPHTSLLCKKILHNKKNSLYKKKNLNTCSKESAQNIINPFTALVIESVVNLQPRLHVLRRVLRRVKERESARKRNREENLSVEKKKEKSLFFRSQIVLLRRGGRGGSSSSPLFLRELDVFSFFFGRFFLLKKCGKRLVVARHTNTI